MTDPQNAPNATPQAVAPKKEKTPIGVHILCGWPLLLVAIGGAIGGALGGAAWGVNTAIYKSKLPMITKVVLNLVVGSVAIGTWLAIVAALKK
jgi:hypothetical protein